MTRSLYRLIVAAFLAAFLATVHASTAIIVPDEFIADRQMEIKVDARIDDRPDLQARFNAYRVFLSTQPPGWVSTTVEAPFAEADVPFFRALERPVGSSSKRTSTKSSSTSQSPPAQRPKEPSCASRQAS